MRLFQIKIGAAVLLVAGLASGCRLFDQEATVQGRSPLRPARPAPNSVAIEMMWVRFPAGDPQLADAAWQEIDETQIDPAVRRELANNGFRVGIIRGTLPDAMARALDRRAVDASTDEADGETGVADEPAHVDGAMTIDLRHEPIVRGRRRQLRRNERWEIQASDVYPSLPLLVSDGRELSGRPYGDAQAIYALRIDPQPDRTVRMELTPELHHGQYRMRRTASEEGVFRQEWSRDREEFLRMRMRVKLAPGEMLVLMSLPNAGNLLGNYFHTVEGAEGRQQKLILLRLAQVPASDTFATSGN